MDIDEAVEISEELTDEAFEEQLISRFQPAQAESTSQPEGEEEKEEKEEAPTSSQMGVAVDILERGLQACAFPEIDAF